MRDRGSYCVKGHSSGVSPRNIFDQACSRSLACFTTVVGGESSSGFVRAIGPLVPFVFPLPMLTHPDASRGTGGEGSKINLGLNPRLNPVTAGSEVVAPAVTTGGVCPSRTTALPSLGSDRQPARRFALSPAAKTRPCRDPWCAWSGLSNGRAVAQGGCTTRLSGVRSQALTDG